MERKSQENYIQKPKSNLAEIAILVQGKTLRTFALVDFRVANLVLRALDNCARWLTARTALEITRLADTLGKSFIA